MISEIFDVVKGSWRFVSSRAEWMRIRGYRVQIILGLHWLNEQKELEFLAVKSGFGGAWGFPQEGVNRGESFEESIKRCLKVELGVESPELELDFERRFCIRKIQYMGFVNFKEERVNERDITDNAAGGIYEFITMKGKAYWLANIRISQPKTLRFSIDKNEVVDYERLNNRRFIELIKSSNTLERIEIQTKCLQWLTSD